MQCNSTVARLELVGNAQRRRALGWKTGVLKMKSKLTVRLNERERGVCEV